MIPYLSATLLDDARTYKKNNPAEKNFVLCSRLFLFGRELTYGAYPIFDMLVQLPDVYLIVCYSIIH